MDPGGDLSLKADADDDPCIRAYPVTGSFPAFLLRGLSRKPAGPVWYLPCPGRIC